jgi:hypothetical protein
MYEQTTAPEALFAGELELGLANDVPRWVAKKSRTTYE